MIFEKLIEGINSSIEERFEISTSLSEEIIKLCPNDIFKKSVFRLERIAYPKVLTKKTILVVGIEDDKQTVYALQWAALCKEMLIDPESADLYLFICFAQNEPLEVCLRIESTEQFCRKYVLHPDEPITHFLERTFLAKPNFAAHVSLSADPIIKSFISVQNQHDWFKADEQNKWKDILLSGLTGSDLIEELFNLNKMNNETSEENINQ